MDVNNLLCNYIMIDVVFFNSLFGDKIDKMHKILTKNIFFKEKKIMSFFLQKKIIYLKMSPKYFIQFS